MSARHACRTVHIRTGRHHPPPPQLYRLADMYLVHGCVPACVRELSKLRLADLRALTAEDVLEVLRLPMGASEAGEGGLKPSEEGSADAAAVGLVTPIGGSSEDAAEALQLAAAEAAAAATLTVHAAASAADWQLHVAAAAHGWLARAVGAAESASKLRKAFDDVFGVVRVVVFTTACMDALTRGGLPDAEDCEHIARHVLVVVATACVDALTCGGLPDDEDCEHARHVLERTSSANIPSWGACARRWLALEFGDVNRVLNTPGLMARFLGLNTQLLLAWLEDAPTVVLSENDVMLAVHKWVLAAPREYASRGYRRTLVGMVRAAHLSPNFRRLLLTRMKWAWPNNKLDLLLLTLDNPNNAHHEFDGGWRSAPRPRLPADEAEKRCTLLGAISRQDLQAPGDNSLLLTVGPRFIEGNMFRLDVIYIISDDMLLFELSIGIASYEEDEGDEEEVLVEEDMCAAHVKYEISVQQRGAWLPAVAHEDFLVPGSSSCKRLYGLPRFDRLDELEAQGFLEGGELRVKCRLLEVN